MANILIANPVWSRNFAVRTMQLLSYRSSSIYLSLQPGWMLILAAVCFASCALPCRCVAGTAQTEDARPVLFYTDLDSGPATGGENGVDGAYVCVYGENFGEKRKSTRMVFGGAEVAAYRLWHDPGAPYQAGHYAKICGQISHLTKFGSAGVQLKEPHASSNTLPFTVRPGRVRFVSPSGNDKTGDGSAARPWLTVKQCKSKIEAGDLCYLRDGVTVTSNESYGAAMVLDSSGSPGLPKAIIAYPGARVMIDNSATNGSRGIYNYKPNVRVSYWTIAGLTINSNQMALQLSPGMGIRIVDNDIMCTGRGCNAPEGGITATGKSDELSNISFLGNRIHDVGCHDDPDYQNSAHPCAWIKNAPKGSRISASEKSYTLTEWPGSFSPGTDVMANGQVRKILTLVRSGNQWTGRLDEPFVPDLPKGTIYEYRFSSPVKLYHNVYFGYIHGLDFGWNEIDGKGQACRGLQFHSTGGYDAYDLHIHDNLIHDTTCDCLNFSTVDPSKGEVEVYNNVLYNCGTDTVQGMSSSFAGIYISNGSAYRDPTWWSPKHHYAVNDLIDDDTNIEKCVTAGISGQNRPVWNSELGGKTADNDVVWVSVGPAHRRSGRVEFFNNTIYNAGLGGQRNWNTGCWTLSATESNTSPAIGLNATNNVCFQPNVNGQSYAFFNGFDSNHRKASTYVAGTNNLFYGLAGAACNAMYSPSPSPANQGCPAQLVHNLSVEPGLVNVSRFNFHVLPVSPLRGTGVRSKHSKNDQDGVPRAEPPSIGAYE